MGTAHGREAGNPAAPAFGGGAIGLAEPGTMTAMADGPGKGGADTGGLARGPAAFEAELGIAGDGEASEAIKAFLSRNADAEEWDTILVVFTGGTIGSRASGDLIDVDEEAGYELLERYEAGRGQSAGAEIRFEVRQPFTELSENLGPSQWEALIACVAAENPARYAGIIVTHGSDTLPYTSAMLSYVFAGLRIPLVLVAANYPLADPRSNGLRNFAGAVDFIRSAGYPGVYAVYANDPSAVAVHLGTRLTEALPFTDAFESAYAAPLGWMQEGRFVHNPHPVVPHASALRARREAPFPPEMARFSTGIQFIRPYPGLDYGQYDFSVRRPEAVLHGLYHSATASSRTDEGYQASLTAFASYCAEHGIDLYLAPAKNAGAVQYRSAGDFMAGGRLIPLRQMTVEAALVKLMLAYGTYPGEDAAVRLQRRHYLTHSAAFEIHEGGAW